MALKFYLLVFDEWNDQAFAEHRVADWEVKQVFDEEPIFVRNSGGHAAEILMIGPTEGMRFLTVPLLAIEPASGIWRPVTAWDSDAEELVRYERAARR